ncbi:MAG: RluA family pseudouridine synthase [Treponema sp.]|nr:RluA family pseudouridine synthase [Treponema sp.]
MPKAGTDYKKEHKADFGKEKIELLYEDEALAIIFKPSGMLTVPYPGSHSKTAEDALEAILRKKGSFSNNHRPFVVHRLDRDTSGVMMFALTAAAQKKIMDSWQKMVTERLYIALAENPEKTLFLKDSGLIDDELAYNSHNIAFVPKFGDEPNQEKAKNAIKEAGRHDNEKSVYSKNLTLKNGKAEFKTISARTHYKILLRGKFHSLFELSLDTGRKNQIRAHLASKGYPLAGDENYRAKTDPFARLALHARTLEFIHPYSGEKMKFEIPEPAEWRQCVEKNTGNIPAVWAREWNTAGERNRKSNKKPQKKDIYEEAKKHSKPTKRQMAGMDFIQKGKLHR